jgi:hypothetical protein
MFQIDTHCRFMPDSFQEGCLLSQKKAKEIMVSTISYVLTYVCCAEIRVHKGST